ncbi:MAG: Nramp family divalent metal transporter [Balneolaceae bacterium]
MASFSWQGIKNSLGPGLLISAAAIGVSHLVQSTRAGADYGFALVWAVVLANLFKYPFLEFGPRYAIAAGETMIEGYKRLGNWAIWIFVIFTVSTMFIIYAAVTVVTASLAAELTGIPLNPFLWSLILAGLCSAIMYSGKYSVLDSVVKVIMTILALSTFIALIAAVAHGEMETLRTVQPPTIWTTGGVAFLIALMGWMPIPIDAAAWHSIWTVDRISQTRYTPKMSESLIDFNIGYIGASLLAVCFLLLGALVMFGSGEEFASSGAVFSRQLIHLYTANLGSWAYVIIVICAFTTMFSTTLAVTDVYPRTCRKIIEVLNPDLFERHSPVRIYRILLGLLVGLSLSILFLMGDQFTFMVDLATTLSFLAAPVLAYLNYRLVRMPHILKTRRPRPWLNWLSVCGLIFLTGFALLYIYWMIRF